jgi:hypothetical protein
MIFSYPKGLISCCFFVGGANVERSTRKEGTMKRKALLGLTAAIVMVSWIFTSPFLYKSAYADSQTQWSELPPIDSYTSPAVSGHQDRRLYIVGIAFNGLVSYTSADKPGSWTAWEIIGPQPSGGLFSNAFYADPNTPPLIVRDETTIYLFVRSKDNNLYETHKQGSSDWSNWQKLTSDGRVAGRISVALTQLPKSFHVIYSSANSTVEYRRFLADSSNWTQSGTVEQWDNAVEGTIGTDGTNRIVVVIRRNDRQLLLQSRADPWIAQWTFLGLLSAGAQGNFYDISEIVYTGGAFHVAYAINHRTDDVSDQYVNEIQHMRMRPGQDDTHSIRSIASYNPVVTDPDGMLVAISHPRISLNVYRNKLVLAYRDPMGFVRYARWDNADPVAPWIAGNAIPDPTRRTDHRPALGVLDRRPFLTYDDYGKANFGNDLFAAIAETGTYSLRVMNFSRALFTKEVNAQFSLYNSNSDGQQVVCRNQNDPLAPSLIADIGQDGRPFFTELGYVLWTLPNWLFGTNFKTAGTLGCQAGNTSGRFDPNPTCNDTKYPVIIISQGGDGICNGVWVHRGHAYNSNLFHELAHSLSGGTLGLSDNNSEPPTAMNEARTGIPLAALIYAFNLFGSRVNADCFGGFGSSTCPGSRAIGFTGEYSNYDVTTRQHSFIGAIRNYFSDGGQMRNWIQQDLQQNDTLLQDKYNWIKQYIFRGIEFNKDNDPLTIAYTPPPPGGYITPLYFPHIATSIPWQTEIAIINTGYQTVTGSLTALSDAGQALETKNVILSGRGRRQINIAGEFQNHTNIAYITFYADSNWVQGYTKFSREGYYRVAIPAVKEVNGSDIYLSHIAADADWWTGVSLVNTTSAQKVLTIAFNNGQSRQITLNANQHTAFNIAQEFFNNEPQPGIQSAVITNASGVIGLELFGSAGWGTQLEGILLADKTTSTLYYPHVDNNGWWTGIVAYNPSASACTITITPYSALGTALTIKTLSIAEKGKYVGAVSSLGLPAQTAWFKIDSTSPLTGFEIFGTTDGNQLAAYAGAGGTGAKAGVFAKIEKNGWTGIAFVNTEESVASVTLTAYNDAGALVATQVLPVGGHAKVVNPVEAIFSQDISSATYIAYSSERNVVGFQLNGSADWTMLDGLPGM